MILLLAIILTKDLLIAFYVQQEWNAFNPPKRLSSQKWVNQSSYIVLKASFLTKVYPPALFVQLVKAATLVIRRE